MSELAIGIVYSLAGIGVYELAHRHGLTLAVVVVVCAALAAFVLIVLAWFLGTKRPLLTAVLVELGGAFATVAIGGTFGALLVLATVQVLDALGKNQNASSGMTLEYVITAVIAIAITFLAKIGDRVAPAAFARRFIRRRYEGKIPAMPRRQGAKLTAYDTITDAQHGEGKWGVWALKNRLRDIKAAGF